MSSFTINWSPTIRLYSLTNPVAACVVGGDEEMAFSHRSSVTGTSGLDSIWTASRMQRALMESKSNNSITPTGTKCNVAPSSLFNDHLKKVRNDSLDQCDSPVSAQKSVQRRFLVCDAQHHALSVGKPVGLAQFPQISHNVFAVNVVRKDTVCLLAFPTAQVLETRAYIEIVTNSIKSNCNTVQLCGYLF